MTTVEDKLAECLTNIRRQKWDNEQMIKITIAHKDSIRKIKAKVGAVKEKIEKYRKKILQDGGNPPSFDMRIRVCGGVKVYTDNAMNRRLNRVGKPYSKRRRRRRSFF